MIMQAPKAVDIGGYYSSSISEADKQDPEKVGAMFEAIFYRMILKESRESSLGDEIFGNQQVENYKEMRDEELAQALASQGHLGIKQLVVDHIHKLQGEDTVPPEKFHEVFYAKDPEKRGWMNTLSLGLLK